MEPRSGPLNFGLCLHCEAAIENACTIRIQKGPHSVGLSIKSELAPEDQNGPREEGVRLLHMPALAASFLTCFVVQIERRLLFLGIDHRFCLNFAQKLTYLT